MSSVVKIIWCDCSVSQQRWLYVRMLVQYYGLLALMPLVKNRQHIGASNGDLEMVTC